LAGELRQNAEIIGNARRNMTMALYIKTEDYIEYGISKNSDLDLVSAAVQKDLKIERVFVTFVNEHEYIRVDFLHPRPPRRARRKRHYQGGSRAQQQA
jgi:hypothetical protein